MRKRLFNITIFLTMMLIASCGGKKEAVAPSGEEAADVTVTAQVNRAELTIGDILTLTITVSTKPGISVSMPEIGKDIADLKIIDRERGAAKEIDDRIETRTKYKLQAEKAGSYIIPAFDIEYVDKDDVTRGLSTNEIYVKVLSAIGADEEFKDIIDIKPLADVSTSYSPLTIAVIVAALVIIIVAIWFIVRRIRKKRRAAALFILPAHEIALKELDALKGARLLEDGKVKSYHFRLSEIFRSYLEDRYSFSASEWTTEEILPYVTGALKFDDVLRDMVSSILTKSDMVKFADHLPEGEASRLELSRAYKFVDQTMVKEEDVQI